MIQRVDGARVFVEADRKRIPHTNTQLARGIIGLFVGGATAVIGIALVYLLDAPLAVLLGLGLLATVGGLVALVMPIWYWLLEPFRAAGEPD